MKLCLFLLVTMVVYTTAEQETMEDAVNELRSFLLDTMQKRELCHQTTVENVCASHENYGKPGYTCICENNYRYYTAICSCTQDKRSVDETMEEGVNELRSLSDTMQKRELCYQTTVENVCALNENYGKPGYTCICENNYRYYTAICSCTQDKRSVDATMEEGVNELRSLSDTMQKRELCHQTTVENVCASNENYGKPGYSCKCENNYRYYTAICSCTQDKRSADMADDTIEEAVNDLRSFLDTSMLKNKRSTLLEMLRELAEED